MKKRLTLIIVLLLTVSIIASGCSISKTKNIGTVNGEKIPYDYYTYFLESIKSSIEQNAVDPATVWSTPIDGKNPKQYAKDTALDELVAMIVQAQKASEFDVELTESQEQEIIDYKKSVVDQLGRDQYLAYLEEVGISDKTFTDILKLQDTARNVYEYVISSDSKFEISDEEAVQFYEDEKEARFALDEENIVAKHILISILDENGDEYDEETKQEKLTLAEEILLKIQNGEDFDTLMNEYSEDPGLATNPDGYMFAQNGQMVEPFETAAFNLEEGQVSEIVETDFGYHIIKVVETGIMYIPYEDYADAIKNYIQVEKYYDEVDTWKNDAEISIDQDVIDKITF